MTPPPTGFHTVKNTEPEDAPRTETPKLLILGFQVKHWKQKHSPSGFKWEKPQEYLSF